MRTRAAAALAASAVLASTLVPLSAADPALDGILARHLAARGGYERIKAVQTLRITRTVSTFSANIRTVILKKRPGAYRGETTVPGRPTSLRVLGPEGLWELGPDGKVADRPAELAAELRELDGDFDGPLVDHAQKGHTIAYGGRHRIGGIDTHKLTVTLASGAARQVYLDAVTFLERRQVGTITLPQGKAETTLTFGDYRTIGGLAFPFAIDEERASFPVQSFAIYTDTVELDTPIDDAVFLKPRS